MAKYMQLYLDEIMKLHGVLVSIISDRAPQFTSRFWKGLGNKSGFEHCFPPQTYGQSKRTIQTLEDMLRTYVMDFGGSWKKHLPLEEFAYNNTYHVSIKMAPFEALYSRRCRSLMVSRPKIQARDWDDN